MDPNAALLELVAAVATGDFDDARERLDALESWANGGGWLPSTETLANNLL